jgi:hypothetical protein
MALLYRNLAKVKMKEGKAFLLKATSLIEERIRHFQLDDIDINVMRVFVCGPYRLCLIRAKCRRVSGSNSVIHPGSENWIGVMLARVPSDSLHNCFHNSDSPIKDGAIHEQFRLCFSVSPMGNSSRRSTHYKLFSTFNTNVKICA